MQPGHWDTQTSTADDLTELHRQMSTLTVEERKQVGEDFRVLGPIFLNIPATKLAVIVMHEVMSSPQKDDYPYADVC